MELEKQIYEAYTDYNEVMENLLLNYVDSGKGLDSEGITDIEVTYRNNTPIFTVRYVDGGKEKINKTTLTEMICSDYFSKEVAYAD